MIGSRAWIPISLQISRRSTRLSCIAVFPSSGAIFDLDGIQQRVAELDERMSAPDFWDDQNAALALMAEVQRRVKESFGVTLEPEVKRIGEF